MKCPHCQAVLLPVDGEMFCLQCGEVYPKSAMTQTSDRPKLDDTTDPLLQKAINDGSDHPIDFAPPPVVEPPKRNGFASLRHVMSPNAALQPLPATAALVVTRSQLAAEPLRPVSLPVQAPAAAQILARPKPRPEQVLDHPSEQQARQAEPMTYGAIMRQAWIAGALGAFIFVGLNLAVGWWYSGKVMPGVRVANLAVGGAGAPLLEDQLRLVEAGGSVAVRSGNLTQTIAMASVGKLDIEKVKHDAMQVGRTSPLPLAGLVQAWYSQPVPLAFVVDEPKLKRAVEEVAQRAQRPARSAVLMIVNGKTVVLREQTGQQVDSQALESAVRKALASGTDVTVAVRSVPADVAAVGLAGKSQQAEQMMATVLKLKIGREVITPTAAQIGAWLVPAQAAVSVSPERVGEYLNGLPGRFDRAAAVAPITEAVQALRDAEISLTGRQRLAAVQSVPTAPIAYTYCLRAPSGLEQGLKERVKATLSAQGGWNLGGRIAYTFAESNCDWEFSLMNQAQMKALAPACASQVTCSVDGRVGIQTDAWQAQPKSWSAGLEAYQAELINHEVGHMLGYDHPACGDVQAKPLLSEPDVTLGSGCSPQWYALPADAAASAVRPGF